MLLNVILILIVLEGAANIGLAYKNYKEVKELKAKINGSTEIVQEVKITVDGAGKSISEEIRKHIYNLSFMGIKIK